MAGVGSVSLDRWEVHLLRQIWSTSPMAGGAVELHLMVELRDLGVKCVSLLPNISSKSIIPHCCLLRLRGDPVQVTDGGY